MATSFVTLNDLPGGDPAAADNSSATTDQPGASQTPSDASAAGETTLATRVAELEALISRHRQQLTGSQGEVQRLRQELDQMRQAPPQAATQAPAAAPPQQTVKLTEAIRKLELEDDPSLLEAWEQSQRGGGLSREEIQAIVQQAQAPQQTQQTLQQAIVQRHPELLSDQAFTQGVGERYQELANDPLTRTLHPPDPQFLYTEPSTQMQYDMRVLMQAANEVKAKTPPRAATQPSTLGITGGSGSAPSSSGPSIPRSLVGPNGVLSDPTVQAALRNLGWGSNIRTQAQAMIKHLSPAAKARWERGEI